MVEVKPGFEDVRQRDDDDLLQTREISSAGFCLICLNLSFLFLTVTK